MDEGSTRELRWEKFSGRATAEKACRNEKDDGALERRSARGND